MKKDPPKKIAINHDDYHAEHIGKTKDGRQFFLTTPFEPGFGKKPGGEYVALYLFDKEGELVEAKIDALGPRETFDKTKRKAIYEARLKELGDVTFCRIEVAPFSVTHFDTEFGLLLREPEDEEDVWAVELHPGNYMAFFEPWDSGDYDT